jgi:enterobactin synthetase component D
VSVSLGAGQEAFAEIDLPQRLQRAVATRQLQYRAGRHCALEALRILTGGRVFEVPRCGEGGEPIWPEGFVGSVTHTAKFAAAAVALVDDAGAVGIDSEEIVSTESAQAIATVVASRAEIAVARAAVGDLCIAQTLVFSAKEAIFKCLYPRVGRFFDFDDVVIRAVDATHREYVADVVRALSPRVPARMRLVGRFDVDACHVHTGIMLPPGEITTSDVAFASVSSTEPAWSSPAVTARSDS